MSENLIPTKDVARRLGITPSAVRAGVRRGQIPVVILWAGRRRRLVRFRPEDIESLIRAGEVPTSHGQ